jgi:flagellin
MLNANRDMAMLASGDRIFAASEDPAGLVISEQLRSQIASLNAEIENLSATSNKYSYAASSLEGMNDQLSQIRSLAVAAGNEATNSPEAQAAYDRAAADLVTQYNRTIANTEYNGRKVLDGSDGSLANLAELRNIDLSSAGAAEASITIVESAMDEVEQAQIDLGATQRNELDSHRAQLEVTRENLIASESGIRDADFASVYTDFVANMIRAQVGLALSTYARYSGIDVVKLLDR